MSFFLLDLEEIVNCSTTYRVAKATKSRCTSETMKKMSHLQSTICRVDGICLPVSARNEDDRFLAFLHEVSSGSGSGSGGDSE